MASLDTIFLEARAVTDPAERAAYLAKACGADADLRTRIEAMLKDAEGAAAFFGPEDNPRFAAAPPLTEGPGTVIGRYKLLQKIGEGGMGVVYMAEQREPVVRKVALKIIKLGMDTRQVIARFEAERQALALMDHPNIAKIFDAGVTDTPLPASGHPLPSSAEGRGQGEGSPPGTRHSPLATYYGRPFFVMELVRGIPITRYCDENGLPPDERLKLFVQVCQAVQHAHQKGIIHRDLKPSNIFVTVNDDVPVPKVIDFGIAKATEGRLTDKTVFTAFEQFIGTPAYMSPEQAAMTSLDIDTRSDIYSLGVLLYELLTGRTPFEPSELLAAGLDEMRRIIREVEPVKPSTRLTQELATAASRSADFQSAVSPISNRQADESSEARRHTEGSQAGSPAIQQIGNLRYSRPSPVQIKDLIPLLRGDLDWIVMKCLEKNRTRRYETANGLASDIKRHLNNEPVVARPPSNLYRLQKLVRRNKLTFTAVSAVTAALILGLGLSTWLFLKERESHDRAVAAEEAQSKLRQQAEANEQKARIEAARSAQVAEFLKDMLESADPSIAQGQDGTMLRGILAKAAERVGQELKEQPEVEAELRSIIGNTYWELGDYPKAVEMHRAALHLRKAVFGETNELVAASLHGLGRALKELHNFAEAETVHRQALALRRELLGDEHPVVANSLTALGDVLGEVGRLAEAETLVREAVPMQRKLFDKAHPDLANSLNSLGGVIELQLREAAAMQRRLFGTARPDLGDSLDSLGGVPDYQRKLAEAEKVDREALALWQTLLGPEHPAVASALVRLGMVLYRQGKLAEAETALRDSMTMRQKLLGEGHKLVASSAGALAFVLSFQGKLTEAILLSRETLTNDLKRNAGSENPRLGNALRNLALMLRAAGHAEEAASTYREMLAARKKQAGDAEGRGDAIALNQLAWLLATSDDPLVRDGPSAVDFAEKAVATTHRKNPQFLNTLAAAYAETSRFAEAVSVQQEAIGLLTDQTQKDELASRLSLYQANTPYRHSPLSEAAADLLKMATSHLLKEGKFAEAEPLARRCLALREQALPDDWVTFETRSLVGASLLGQQQYAGAEPLLLSGYEGMKQREDRIPAYGKARLNEAGRRLVQLYEAWGKPDAAAQWRAKLPPPPANQTNPQP